MENKMYRNSVAGVNLRDDIRNYEYNRECNNIYSNRGNIKCGMFGQTMFDHNTAIDNPACPGPIDIRSYTHMYPIHHVENYPRNVDDLNAYKYYYKNDDNVDKTYYPVDDDQSNENDDIITDIYIKDSVSIKRVVGDYYAWGYPHDLLDFSLYVEKVSNLKVSTNAFGGELCHIDDVNIDLVVKGDDKLHIPVKKTTDMYERIIDSLKFNLNENEFTLYNNTLFEIIFRAEDSPKELKLRILNNYLEAGRAPGFQVSDIINREIEYDVVYLDTVVEYKGIKVDVRFKINVSETNMSILIANNDDKTITPQQLPMLFLDRLIEEHKN